MKAPLRVILLVTFLCLAACQPSGKATAKRTYVIAMTQLTSVDIDTMNGFREGMEQLGYQEGSRITYLITPPAGSVDKLEGMISANLAKNPDLYVVSSTPAAQTLKRLTEAIGKPPIVFVPVNDPLAAGVVTDLKHPGGHITGVRLPTGEDLRMGWFARIVPNARKIFLPYTPDDKSSSTSMEQASKAAELLGLTLLKYPIPLGRKVTEAFAALPADADAIYLPRDSRIEAAINDFVELADKNRLPMSVPSKASLLSGALVSYGFDHQSLGRQAARIADQILKGVSPGDLPVEMAEDMLMINLATANRLGIPISDDILSQAGLIVRK